MSTKDYALLLKSVLKMQITSIEEETNWEENEYYEGMRRGFQIAVEKIDASKFLYQENKKDDMLP